MPTDERRKGRKRSEPRNALEASKLLRGAGRGGRIDQKALDKLIGDPFANFATPRKPGGNRKVRKVKP